MRIDIEDVVGGKPGRMTIATTEKELDQASVPGVGLRLNEVKALIGQLQKIVSAEQRAEVNAAHSRCAECKQSLPRKGSAAIVYRTAFGKLQLDSSRLYSQCGELLRKRTSSISRSPA